LNRFLTIIWLLSRFGRPCGVEPKNKEAESEQVEPPFSGQAFFLFNDFAAITEADGSHLRKKHIFANTGYHQMKSDT
jgi:hypothetical protein